MAYLEIKKDNFYHITTDVDGRKFVTARGWEDVLALILFFRLICMGIIVVSITIWIVHLYRHKKWTAGSVLQYILDKKYDFESRRKYYEKENKLF